MKKILVTILLMITALSANAFSAKLSVDAFKIMPGESKDIYISMDNADMPVIGIQVDIALPTGISLTDDPSLVAERIGSYTNKYGKTVASAKTISSNTVNGKLRLAILSLSDQAPFSGTSGDIIKIPIKADESMTLGNQTITLSGIELSPEDLSAPYYPADASTSFSVYKSCTVGATAGVGGTVSGGGSYDSGASVTLTATANSGYTFKAWNDGTTDVSKDNPYTFTVSKDVNLTATFSVNTYKVNYTIDGIVVHTDNVDYGAAVTIWTAPTKEGYTFAGWSPSVPSTMPANDVNVTGSYTAVSYNLIYTVDGKEYKKVSLPFGSAITPEAVPTKEGYTFSGWSAIPTTMPSNDVTITGTFTVKSYKVNYTIDGIVVHTDNVDYGAAVTIWTAPTKEGYTFAGWSPSVPSTMPANDMDITGSYTVNNYNVVYKVDGTVYQTVSVAYGSPITLITAPEKEGFTFSGWSPAPSTMPANDIEITGTFVSSGIANITMDTYVNVYSIEGRIVKSHIMFGQVSRDLPTGLYIINGKKVVINHRK